MKKIVIVFLVALMACEAENLSSSYWGDGNYVGTFFRGTPTSLPSPVHVNIKIEGNKFEGEADGRIPAICRGTFQMKNDSTIQFTNECVFTADFDWTYILQGDFTMKVEEPFIYLTKRYPDNQTYDVYKMEKVAVTKQ